MAQITIQSSSGGTGFVRSQDSNYSTARGATTGNLSSTSSSGEIQAGAMLNGGTYDIKRAFIQFDTSSVPDNAIITAVTLRLFGRATDTTRTLDVFEGTQSTSIDTDDFDALNSTEFGSEIFSGSDAWEEIELNASGIAIINKTGNTFLALRHQWDTDNTTPNTNDQFMVWDTHDGTNPEELVIVYDLPTTSTSTTTTSTSTSTTTTSTSTSTSTTTTSTSTSTTTTSTSTSTTSTSSSTSSSTSTTSTQTSTSTTTTSTSTSSTSTSTTTTSTSTTTTTSTSTTSTSTSSSTTLTLPYMFDVDDGGETNELRFMLDHGDK